MRHRLLSLAVFASLLSSTLLGQVSGTLTGSVQDPSGSGVGNADIELFLEGGSKAVLAAKSTAEGLFTISGVRPETYRVKVSATGFSASFLDGVRVEPPPSHPRRPPPHETLQRTHVPPPTRVLSRVTCDV